MTSATPPTTFVCAQCGACCRWHGLVRLTDAEVDAIAAYVGLSPRGFIERCTEVTPDRRGLTLRECPDGACIMLDEHGLCRIHAVKPRQCREFPWRWHVPGYEALCQAGRKP